MFRLFILTLTLSFPLLFGVDTPSEIGSNSQRTQSQEIQFNADEFQENRLIKKGLSNILKQAKVGKKIPKPIGSPTVLTQKKGNNQTADLFEMIENHKKLKKSNIQIKKEAYLEKQNLAKQKLEEFRASVETRRTNAELPKYVPSDRIVTLNQNKGERQIKMKNSEYDWSLTSEDRDEFGYEYMFNDESFEWIELDEADTLWLSDDDGEWVELPGEFPFYDMWYDSVGISSNGWVTFINSTNDEQPYLGEIWSDYLPSGDTSEYIPSPVIAVFATDGFPNGGGYGPGLVTFGESDDSFVITWSNWSFCCEDSSMYDMQLILFPSGDFVMQYNNVAFSVDDYNWTTIGIQNEVADDGITVWSPDDEESIYSGMRLKFDHPNDGETGTISGMVYDFENRPFANASIWIANNFDEQFTLSTDETGSFEIQVPVGSYFAAAYENDGEVNWDDIYDGMIEVSENEELTLEFTLYPRDMYGKILLVGNQYNENGEQEAIINASVTIEDTSGNVLYELSTSLFGVADQSVLPNPYLVRFESEYGSDEQWVYTYPDSINYVQFDFYDDGGEHGWIEGQVMDSEGWGISDAQVMAWNDNHWFEIVTDIDGYFWMEVPAGQYEMDASGEGYHSQMNWVQVHPNETSYVEFWLDEEMQMTVVSGQVSDEAGNPISFAFINASYLCDDWELEGTISNEEGYFELYLQEGDYRVSAGAEGFWVSAYDSVHVGMDDDVWLDFSLSHVESFDGAWQGNINLMGNHDPGMIFLGIMGEDYQVLRFVEEPGFQEVDLPNGSYHLFAGAEGYQDVFIPFGINIENNVVNFDINLFEYGFVNPPHIQFAGDVPNDQGRQMRLVWNPGMPGEWDYFSFYSIWRQVNQAPQELWDFVTTVPWHGMEAYSAVVPTLGDSTHMGVYWSTFRVTAHTENPNEFYDSAPITGYSIDNLHPGAPGGIQAFTGNEGILLTWDVPMDEDFGYHRIYRHDVNTGDIADEFTTVDTFFVDNISDGNFEYWVTAVDINGNESNPSDVVAIMLAIEDGLTIPTEFALQQNYPNPFNPSTQIQFALPTNSTVSISIYDVMGREVRQLVNKEVSAGYHSTLWNATNDLGSPVAAGVYIYTISAGEYRAVKKMILLK